MNKTSVNPAKTNWTSIATNKPASGIISVMDTNARNHGGRFYRAARR
jgi:hypothetical protein